MNRTLDSTDMNRPVFASLGARLAAIVRGLLRLVLALSAFVLMLAALLVGLLLALGLVAWALVRGKRPAPGLFNATFRQARRRGGARPSTGPVIDIEAREVPEPARAEERTPGNR